MKAQYNARHAETINSCSSKMASESAVATLDMYYLRKNVLCVMLPQIAKFVWPMLLIRMLMLLIRKLSRKKDHKD